MIQPVPAPVGRPLVAAVTGTNGKTSVATATLQLMRAAGLRAAGCDSTGITDVHGAVRPAEFRRSERFLPELIAEQVALGAEAISLEAFVGILKDGLLAQVEVDVAVCTGLERDHLDVHGSLEQYWGAKLRLFEEHLRPDGVAVLAADCAQGDLVRAAVARRGARPVTVGPDGDVELEGAEELPATDEDGAEAAGADGIGAGGARLGGTLRIGSRRFPVVLPTVHAIAVGNLLLAASAVIGLGGDPAAVADGLARVAPPPGRLEIVGRRDGVTAMVDTAHNPAALRTALGAVRARASGRVLLVVGAGGERDRAKRAPMGAIAAELADLVVLTDDNPRREPPARIRAEVREGCPDCLEIPRRADAIRAAWEMARPGDVVLVAGKGDETVQLVGRERIPHDDRSVLRELLDRG
jgi:UDP-N-acetylmuramoyl-L-alanyl-D-glutamate--2,6-diaminopimelate ligase